MPTYDVPTDEGMVRVTADSAKQAVELAGKGGGMLLPKGGKPAAGLPQAETVYHPGGPPAASQPTDLNIQIPSRPADTPAPPVPGYAPASSEGGISAPPSLLDTLVEAGLKYGPPVLAAYLTGGTSIPAHLAGRLAPQLGVVAKDLGGQLAATGFQQLLGVEKRPGLEPYVETAIADLVGRGAYGVAREGIRKLVKSSPAGQKYLTDAQRDALRFRLDRQMDANEFEQKGFEREINRALGRGTQSQAAFDAQADRAVGEGVQSQYAFKRAADAAMDQGELEEKVLQRQLKRALGQGEQEAETLEERLKTFGQTVRGDVQTARSLRRQTEEEFGLVKSTLVQTQDRMQRQKRLLLDQSHLTKETAVTDARQWLARYNVATDEELAALYAEVDKFNNAVLPDEAFEALGKAQQQLGAREARIASILPDMANPQYRRLGRPGQPAAMAEADVAPVLRNPSAQAAKGGLKNAPSQELELQDFLRQPDAKGKWGIHLSDDELFSEFDALLGKAEGGEAGRRLKNANGLSASAMAQRAHEQGFIESPDVNALKVALDESLAMGRPVYSKFRSFAEVEYPGFVPQEPDVPRTFQGMRDTIKRVGQRLGDARRHGTKEDEAALSSIYGALQDGLQAAEASDALSPAARDALVKANAAFKVRATMEDFGLLVEKNIRTPGGGAERINPGPLLDAIRKDNVLRKNLEDIGALDGVNAMLTDLQAKLKAPKDALRKAHELELTAKGLYRQMSEEEKAMVQRYVESQQSMQERLVSAREGVGDEVAGIRMQAEARAGMFKEQAATAVEDAKRQHAALTQQGAAAQQQATAMDEMLREQGAAAQQQARAQAERLGSEAQAAQGQGQADVEALRRQMEAVPTPQLSHAMDLVAVPAAVGSVASMALGSPVPAMIGGGVTAYGLIVRAMMTPKGQQAVGKILEASGGLLTPSAIIVLSQVAKEPTMQLGTAVGGGIRQGVGLGK